ncbi:hypothetical protein HC028_21355 [Planosporangium flavigriseum]|uniref:Uncharacterized protein n=1 Tax=Planosporangium flavigriseum TaxID=373681 RepID=A0A8J3M3G3_9ACTN|nr:hypothetical protein [Planosporangium flavigriseum]NJC67031.1 hypothetical protein [Planosporangium flavigriseum]GIG76155.1 hypothetical protein Pfl04_45590 [Planosporangium flavigriseum]
MSELASRLSSGFGTASGNIVSTAITAALTAHAGPETAATVGAVVGAATEEGVDFMAQLLRDRRRRSERLVQAATAYADTPAETLMLAVYDDGKKRELFFHAVQAAAQSVENQKIDTLARAFASGALSNDPAVIDEAAIVVDCLSELQAPHLRLLAILSQTPANADLEGEARIQQAQSWTASEMLQRDPGLRNVLVALVAKLTGAGMVKDNGVGTWSYTPRWQLTEFGRICSTYLVARGGD